MINNTILDASRAAVKFADIDGTALQLSQKHAPPSEHLLGMLKGLYILAKLLVGLLHPC